MCNRNLSILLYNSLSLFQPNASRLPWDNITSLHLVAEQIPIHIGLKAVQYFHSEIGNPQLRMQKHLFLSRGWLNLQVSKAYYISWNKSAYWWTCTIQTYKVQIHVAQGSTVFLLHRKLMLILGNEVSIVMKTPAHQNQLAIKAVITITFRDKE